MNTRFSVDLFVDGVIGDVLASGERELNLYLRFEQKP